VERGPDRKNNQSGEKRYDLNSTASIVPYTEFVVAPTFDPFKILGIGQDATDEEVKRAYRASF